MSYIDHIFVLRQILEQTQGWNTSLYVVFADFLKAFDSLHRDSLWKILGQYGTPTKIVNIIQSLYQNFECRIINIGVLTDTFKVKTGVKQGRILPPLLFSLAIDWVMRHVTRERLREIQWSLTSVLEDLEYADDLGLLSSKYQDAQEKTEGLHYYTASSIGLKSNNEKTQVLRKCTTNENPINLDDSPVEDVIVFTYLGSVVTTDGGMFSLDFGRPIKHSPCYDPFESLKIETKIRIFKNNVLSILHYGASGMLEDNNNHNVEIRSISK